MLSFRATLPDHRPFTLRTIRVPSLAAGLAALCLGSCVDQPATTCVTTTAGFAVKLLESARVESVPGACSTFGPDAFNADPEVGISPYYLRGSNGQPDYERGSIAIQTAELGSLVYTAEGFSVPNGTGGQLYSRGDFSASRPDDDNFCSVPTLSNTRVVLPALDPVMDDPATEDVDESFPGQAAVDATLAWSNFRVYITADIFGTQMEADLTDTRVTPTGDSCTISYRALGIAPAVSCWALDPESGDPLSNADGTPQLDPGLCDPDANPDEGRFYGSGLSPSARFSCDPVTAFCLVDGDTIPALR